MTLLAPDTSPLQACYLLIAILFVKYTPEVTGVTIVMRKSGYGIIASCGIAATFGFCRLWKIARSFDSPFVVCQVLCSAS
eukprot:5598186-Amphidinium_carterae.1